MRNPKYKSHETTTTMTKHMVTQLLKLGEIATPRVLDRTAPHTRESKTVTEDRHWERGREDSGAALLKSCKENMPTRSPHAQRLPLKNEGKMLFQT